MVGADLCTIPFALWSAVTLRLGSFDHGTHGGFWLYVISALASVSIFVRLGLYRAVLRYMAGRAISTIFAGVLFSVVLTAMVDGAFFGAMVPKSAWLIDFLMATLYVWGSRWVARHTFGLVSSPRKRVIIYGAGDSGLDLALALKKGRDFQPVAFVDDDAVHHGSLVHGLEIFPTEFLEPLVARYGVSQVMLAMPSAPKSRRSEIIKALLGLGVRVQTVPDLSDILAGRARVDDVQDVDIADLLGRDPVPPHPGLLGACITGKSVMVTGAGGSIGSELCRQIIRLNPKRLVLIEKSELALYTIDRELRAQTSEARSVEIVPLIGNTHQKSRIKDVIQTFAIQTIYHAAAYKHVPLVEQNVVHGVFNNVMSTYHTAEAAAECGVETFVLISTDKAVNPTNVMGATKRIAELVLQGMHQCGSATKFCMVRFGNVLGSSGSVVPLFREQVRVGGPVTVTHPQVIRYFMTIPEAAQLVIQAGSMAHGGEVFVLDMGQPIRIVDLAKRMIALTGHNVRDESNPHGDIEIVFTGLRPGEKLFEELLLGDNVAPTEHPMILRAREKALPWSEVHRLLDELRVAAAAFDCRRTIRLLQDAVAEYRAAPHLADLVAARRAELGLDAVNVTDLQSRRRAGSTHPSAAQSSHPASPAAVASLTSVPPPASA
ncbi:MAG: polysaccharide biosynthesis protein [Steroidobacteraceae bacterium]